MPKVKVYNFNCHPLNEMFKGEEVHIGANDYWRDKAGKIKEVDIYEANDYRGQYCPVPFDGSGKMLEDAKYYKKIRLEPIKEDIDEVEDDSPSFKCMAESCKHVSPSSEELEAHIKVRHPHAETLILPDEDKAIRAKQRAKKAS